MGLTTVQRDCAACDDTDIAASELYSEILDFKMLPTTVRSEILLKTSLELLTSIISYGVNTAAHSI